MSPTAAARIIGPAGFDASAGPLAGLIDALTMRQSGGPGGRPGNIRRLEIGLDMRNSDSSCGTTPGADRCLGESAAFQVNVRCSSTAGKPQVGRGVLMSRKVRSGSVLATLIGISAALCLAGCGSSKAGDNTASRSSSTSPNSSAVVQPSSTTTSTTFTTFTTSQAASSSSTVGAPTVNITSEAAYQRAAAVFLPCLRRHGVSVPQSDTKLTLKGVDTTTPQFKRASSACRSVVAAAVAR